MTPAVLALPLIGLVFRRVAAKPGGAEQYLAGALLLGLTVMVGVRAASLRDLFEASRAEARQAVALQLAIDRLAGCRSVSTNDFFVVVDVARRLNLNPAKVRLVDANGENRPAVITLTGDGPGQRERIGPIVVTGACIQADSEVRASLGQDRTLDVAVTMRTSHWRIHGSENTSGSSALQGVTERWYIPAEIREV